MMDLFGIGMVSSLGLDVVTSCAAARAGVTRATELPFRVLEEDASPGSAIGHPVSLLSGGFQGEGRLIRLLEGALRDLGARILVDTLSSHKIGFYLAMPASDRERQALDLIAEEERADYVEQLGEPVAIDERDRARKLLSSALQLAEFPGRVIDSLSAVHVSVSGHASVFQLLQQAQADLESGLFQSAIVSGVDSLLGPRTLSWLKGTNRLKCADCPTGLSPGEAAAILALRSRRVATGTSSPAIACIPQIATTSSPTQFFQDGPGDGVGQLKILRAFGRAAPGSDTAPWVIVDQNGEAYRANDWGHALVRLRAESPAGAADPVVWYPAASFGDTGAASGAVAACVATRAFSRGYAPGRDAMLLTSSDGPDRSGCMISAKET